jgi:eukaryotic-like serine/threonine-protein kinase
MPRSNEKIGPYTLVRELGRGGFGVVWLAERRGAFATTQVALKLTLDDEPDLDAIAQESQVWARLAGHANVLPIIEADTYDGQVVIVSEYAPDGSLADWLKRHGGAAPTTAAALGMTSGILAGLEHLHAKGVIHRDLKPQNILLQGDTPRLTDFGLSRVLKTSVHSATVAGTPAYMAPESFRGDRSELTDVWSVGVILYQLLVGRLPFPEKDLISLMGAIAQASPGALPPTVSMPLQDVILRALQKHPAERYQSAAAMRAALPIGPAGPAERVFATDLPAVPPAPTPPPLAARTPGSRTSDSASATEIVGPPVRTPSPAAARPVETRDTETPAVAGATPETASRAAGDASPMPRRASSGKGYLAIAMAILVVGAIGVYRFAARPAGEPIKTSESPVVSSPPAVKSGQAGGGPVVATAPSVKSGQPAGGEAGDPLLGALGKALETLGSGSGAGMIRGFDVADLGLRLVFLGKGQSEMYAVLGVSSGALVLRVEGNTPAARAEVHAGDVIVAIDGKKLEVEDDLRQALKRIGPGKTKYAIKRGDEVRTIVIDCPDCKAG